MVFFRFLTRPTLLAVVGVLTLGAYVSGTSHAADWKSSPNRRVLPSPQPMIIAPSGAELVGKLLGERVNGSDPDIPLPQRGLTNQEPLFVPLTGPQIYGRREEGSVVLGLRFPIPAPR